MNQTQGLYCSPQRLINGKLPPTLGPVVVRWMESSLTYGPGDLQGEPFKVDSFLKPIIYRLYEYDPETERRLTKRALVGVPKGNSKSEIAAAVGLNELAGLARVETGIPVMSTDPDIPVAAASYDQANLVFGSARVMAEPLKDFLNIYDTEIHRKEGNGVLYRVAAAAGTNDGKRPTAFIADEIHEWVDNKARVHLVLSNGLFKRANSLELNITTAGANLETLAGNLYRYGKKLHSGEVENSSFDFFWWEGPEDVDLDDPEALRAAIRQANPASWLNVEDIAGRYEIDGMPAYEFTRYHLNRFTGAAERWLPVGAFQANTHPTGLTRPDRGSEVVVAFDGSYSQDSTALVGWTMLDGVPHGFLIDVWERPEDNPHWVVPREEVEARVFEVFRDYKVVSFVMDRAKWYDEHARWVERFGEPPILDFPQSRKRMSEACASFYAATVQNTMTHDGNPAWLRHLENSTVKETSDGAFIVKDGRNSPRKIDIAVAGVMGFHELISYYSNNRPVEVSLTLV